MSVLTALPSLAARPALSSRPAPAARSRDAQGGLSVLPGVPASALFGRVSSLLEGEELYPALFEAVSEARTSLKVDFHLLGGPEGAELARLLARRAAQGLRVQVLAWGDAASPALRAALQAARAEGLTVRVGRAAEGAAPLTRPSGKWLIADDRTAYVGALRPAPADGAPVRSGLLRLVGEAAAELGRQFNHDWTRSGGTPLPLAAPAPVRRQDASGVSLVQVAGIGAERKAPRAVLLAALQRAERSLEVCVDVLTDAEVVQALVAARRRGVAVRVLLAERAGRSAGLDAQAAPLARLLEAGVAVRHCREALRACAVEQRLAIVDGEGLVFGTAPWSLEGLSAAGELLVEARGGSDWAAVMTRFAADWAQAAPARAPHAGERLASAAAPVVADVQRALRAHSPRQGFTALWNLHVGVVRIGDRWKLVTDVR